MEVLEAYCQTMLGDHAVSKPVQPRSPSATTHAARIQAPETQAATSKAASAAAQPASAIASQLGEIKQQLWPSSAGNPQGSLSQQAKRKRSKTAGRKRLSSRLRQQEIGLEEWAEPAQASSTKQAESDAIKLVKPTSGSYQERLLQQEMALADPSTLTSVAAKPDSQAKPAQQHDEQLTAAAASTSKPSTAPGGRYQQHVTAFICNKGGTGKTTACINVAGWLAKLGKRVLIIDLDAQASASAGMGVEAKNLDLSSASLITATEDNSNIDNYRLTTEWGVDLIPASAALVEAERLVTLDPAKTLRLSKRINELGRRYDHIFLDVPAGHGALTMAALTAANDIFMPVDSSSFAEKACEILLQMVKQTRAITGNKLKLACVLHKQAAGNFLEKLSGSDRQHLNELLQRQGFDDTPIISIPHAAICERAARRQMMLAEYAPADALSRAYKKVARRAIEERLAGVESSGPHANREFDSINYSQQMADYHAE